MSNWPLGIVSSAQATGDFFQLWSWGGGTSGFFGDGTVTPNKSSPVQSDFVEPISWERNSGQDKVSTGDNNMFVIVGGEMFVWGVNTTNGSLGLGDKVNRSSPVQLGSDTDWEYIAAGRESNISIKGGGLYSWGFNTQGQLGQGDVVKRSVPTQIGSATNWIKCFVGRYNGAAINSDGELYVWGRNGAGQLGQNDVVSRSTPVQIAGTTWNSAAFGGTAALYTKTDGTLWCVGGNNQGLFGTGVLERDASDNHVLRSVVVQVGSETDWVDVRMSPEASVIALKGNGTIWCWGNGNKGAMGQGTAINYSAPVQVGSDSDWTSISAGKASRTAFAVRAGIAYAWGDQNIYGGLGIGIVTDQSVPIVIAGGFEDWVYVESCDNSSFGLRTGS